jgi:hypothetical protein
MRVASRTLVADTRTPTSGRGDGSRPAPLAGLARGRRSVSVLVVVAQSVAQLAALIGIVAGFWHITWVAGVAFLVASLVAVGVHSAGYWRVETRDAES